MAFAGLSIYPNPTNNIVNTKVYLYVFLRPESDRENIIIQKQILYPCEAGAGS